MTQNILPHDPYGFGGCGISASLSGDAIVVSEFEQAFIEEIHLFLSEPVSFVLDLVELHLGILQEFTHVDVRILLPDQLDVGVNDPAVVELKIVYIG
jgi:hypothetical protein